MCCGEMGTLVLFIRIVVYIVQTKAELLTGLSLKKAGLKLRKTFFVFYTYVVPLCSCGLQFTELYHSSAYKEHFSV